MTTPDADPLAVAIVGMSIRLPGADTVEQFWQNLHAGADTITRRGGREPGFVGAYGTLTGTGRFDAARFGVSAAEAVLIDPQQRLLLESVDEALSAANVGPAALPRTAVYAGVGRNGYESWVGSALAGRPGVDEAALELANSREYAASRVAYRLGLGGAAITVQSACSTALVTVHLAWQDLVGRGCDTAVAAVAAVRMPNPGGYSASAGGIGSPSGRCTPFSAAATGTVPGDGVGAVVLKRLADALADGDPVLAVVRGSALTNDGSAKSGFAGVNPAAQATAMRDALAVAGIDPSTVGFVEAHGSGTRLGDAAEWSAMHRAYRGSGARVGAVKGNVGHLREAAGLAGLVKAVLCLQHETLVPIPGLTELSQDLAGLGSSLVPLTAIEPWHPLPDAPLRAGVSAFGLGGTNAHVVLEQAPPGRPGQPDRTGLVLLSSHLSGTLEHDTDAHRAVVLDRPERIGDLARTTQTAARHHSVRRFVLLSGGEDPAGAFAPGVLARQTGRSMAGHDGVAFVLPGVGSHYPGMGVELAKRLPLFAEHLSQVVRAADEIAEGGISPIFAVPAARAEQRIDLPAMLRKRRLDADAGGRDLRLVHLGLFCFEYALARTLMSVGVRPAALLGHSLGEWVGAVLAGVIDLPAALAAVGRRANLVRLAGPGAMLAVAASAADVEHFATNEVWLAADNGPMHTVFSGRPAAVEALAGRLRDAGHSVLPVEAGHPFHTPQLAEAAAALGDDLAGVPTQAPSVPLVSSVLGTWLDDDRVRKPAYWRDHLVSRVRFRAAATLLLDQVRVVVEVGPGTVRPWLRQIDPDAVCVSLVRQSYSRESDLDALLRGLGELWLHGVDVDWAALTTERGPRVLRPAPALDRRHYLPDTPPAPPRRTEAAPEPLEPLEPPVRGGAPDRVGDDPLADHLRERWSALLGVLDVHDDDHFFDLGGDSLLGVHLIAGLRELTGHTVPPEVVFASARFGGMVEAVSGWLATAPPAAPAKGMSG